MRRRRQPLQPSTFPFLAVLLCAMGSLILILLVMDRQARLAARAKAQRQAQELAERSRARREEEAERERERLRLLEARRQEQQALHARLVQESEALRARRNRLQGQLQAAGRALLEQADRRQRLGQDVAREKERLASAKEAWARREEERKADRQQIAALQEEITRLTAGIADLEEELAERKAARARAGRTYSVVPYKGKYGSNRRPVYVECDATGLIFHPDRLALSLTWEPLRILAELQKRTAPEGPEDRPYVLALVRPNGIQHYYPLQGALHRLGVDFGYELIDADWALDFPADGQPLTGAWANQVRPGDPGAGGDGPGRGRGGSAPGDSVRLTRPHPLAPPGSGEGIGAPHPLGARGVGPGGPSGPPLAPGGRGIGMRGEGGPGSPSPPHPHGPSPEGRAEKMGYPQSHSPEGKGQGRGADPAFPGTGERPEGAGDPPFLAGAVPPPRRGSQPGGDRGNGTNPASPHGGQERSEAPPPAQGRGTGVEGQPPPEPAVSPNPEGGKGNSPWKPDRPAERRADSDNPARPSPLFPGTEEPRQGRRPERRRPLLEPVVPDPDAGRRPAWLTGEQPRTIFVECRTAGVIVYPSRRTFTVAQLRAANNPLLAEVRRLLPADSRRAQVDFLVWPEGMRTYHGVYPLLDSLDVPKRRRNLQSGDDVRYLIANE